MRKSQSNAKFKREAHLQSKQSIMSQQQKFPLKAEAWQIKSSIQIDSTRPSLKNIQIKTETEENDPLDEDIQVPMLANFDASQHLCQLTSMLASFYAS